MPKILPNKRKIRWLLLFLIPTLVFSESRLLLGLRGGGSQSQGQSTKTATSTLPVAAANVSIPLHAEKGSHHAEIYIGSPPQRQTVILDTGSRMIAFPCKSCKRCGKHVNPYFEPFKSTTHSYSKCGSCIMKGISTCSMYGNKCTMEQHYTEGSLWAGEEVEDVLWFGSPSVLESVEEFMSLSVFHVFGCQTKSKGLFKEQYADGILGLAMDDRSLVSKMHQEGAIARNAFGLCFSQTGGVLSLGGMLPMQHHVEEMQFTPISREHGLYAIEVVAISVGNITIMDAETRPSLLKRINDGKGCILDSGTTDTHLPADYSTIFEKTALKLTNGLTDFSSAMRTRVYSYDEFLQLPEITFQFANNAFLTIVPHYYMEGTPLEFGRVKPWTGKITLANRIYVEEQQGAVLGQNSMFGHDLLFDTTGYQIGIAKANCSAVFTTS